MHLQHNVPVGFGRQGHAVLALRGQSDQVVVAVAVGDQRRCPVGFEEI